MNVLPPKVSNFNTEHNIWASSSFWGCDSHWVLSDRRRVLLWQAPDAIQRSANDETSASISLDGVIKSSFWFLLKVPQSPIVWPNNAGGASMYILFWPSQSTFNPFSKFIWNWNIVYKIKYFQEDFWIIHWKILFLLYNTINKHYTE